MLAEDNKLVNIIADHLYVEQRLSMTHRDQAVALLEIIDTYLTENVVNINIPSEHIEKREEDANV